MSKRRRRDPMDAAFDYRMGENDGSNWGVYLPFEDEAHVIPEFGPQHTDDRGCFCHPSVRAVEGGTLVIHQAMH